MKNDEIIIKDTHRGLCYEDGVLVKVLGAGRHKLDEAGPLCDFARQPKVEVVLVDMRARDLTIKGQEILTADKVAIRVSILVQFARRRSEGGPARRRQLRGPALQRRAARRPPVAGGDDARRDPHQPHTGSARTSCAT